MVNALREGRDFIRQEIKLRGKNGNIVTVMFSAQAIQMGNRTCILSIVEDISDRKKAEEALVESERRYRALFQNKITAMLIIDPKDDGKIVDANPAAEAFYGWGHKELTGMKINEINIMTKEQVNDEMKKALSNKKNFFQFKHRRADKTIKDVEVYSSNIQIQGKDLLYSIIIDKTEQRKIEENLKKSEFRLARAELVSESGNWEFDLRQEIFMHLLAQERFMALEKKNGLLKMFKNYLFLNIGNDWINH